MMESLIIDVKGVLKIDEDQKNIGINYIIFYKLIEESIKLNIIKNNNK